MEFAVVISQVLGLWELPTNHWNCSDGENHVVLAQNIIKTQGESMDFYSTTPKRSGILAGYDKIHSGVVSLKF